MIRSPLVTICIPSYNHGDYLPTAIESVLTQSYANVECLVFDDGSRDGSWEIAVGYERRYERVRALSHEDRANYGIAATLNAAFAASRGAYVGNLAADDALLPDSVARRVEAIVRDPRPDLVYGRIEMVDAENRPTGVFGGVSPESMCKFDATDDPLQSLLLHDYIPSPTVLLRRDVFDDIGGFSREVYYNDWELWLRLVALGVRIAFVDGAPLVSCCPGAYGDEADLPRRLELFRALAALRVGRFEEPRIRALVSLQQGLQAAQLGDEAGAGEAIDSAFAADSALRDDANYVFWWLAPVQRRSVSSRENKPPGSWLDDLADPRTAPADVTRAGARAGHFGCWATEAAGGRLSPAALDSLRWAVLGNELELFGVRLTIFGALVLRAVRRPSLLRQRWFAKCLLCSAGLWTAALSIRARLGSVR